MNDLLKLNVSGEILPSLIVIFGEIWKKKEKMKKKIVQDCFLKICIFLLNLNIIQSIINFSLRNDYIADVISNISQ